MIVTVLREKDLFNFVLPDKASGQYLIYMDTGSLAASINSAGGAWNLSLEKGFQFTSGMPSDVQSCPISESMTAVIKDAKSSKYLCIMFEAFSHERALFTKYYIPQNGEYIIGRNANTDIQFDSKLVSSTHAVIYIGNDGAWIEDKNTPNGTYVNGRKIQGKVALNDGDLIYIVGLSIIYANHMLALNHPKGDIAVSKRLNKLAAQESVSIESSDFSTSKMARKFFRSPRFAPQITPVNLKIDPPPAPVELQTMPLAYLLGPSITMGTASVFTAVFTIINANGDMLRVMPTLIMSLSMLTMTVLWPILTKKYEKKKKIENEKLRVSAYSKYIAESRQKIQTCIAQQEQSLATSYLEANSLASRVFNLDRSLWERSPWHDDYLAVRLGIGNRRIIGKISCPEKKFKVRIDDLEEKMYQLVEADYLLKSVPITVKLDEIVTGIIGQRKPVRNMLNLIISQLVTLHSYDECKLYVEFDKAEEPYWRYLYDIPHCWDEDQENRNIVNSTGDLGVAMPVLSRVFDERRAAFESGGLKEYDKRYVIILMNRALISTNAVIKSIWEYKEYLGISIIAAFDELKYLPRSCTQIIEVGDTTGRVFNRYSSESSYTHFTPDKCSIDMPAMAYALANITSENTQKQGTLPTLITFLEMMKVGRIEQLNCLTRWREHNASQSIDAELGVDEQGAAFILNLHEKSHGPHGLIAGMTGSGKSELIMTLILSLAVNYHPYDVAFILIDFKGGGMAKAFEKLPHTVGIITNLDGNEIKRSLASINSELRRRQMLFAAAASATGESNIDIYKYQQLYRAHTVSEPLPHLFIISDEFAELKTQHPDFMTQLVSAARIGRSLGVHLILATQKPSGVVDDQIWSNSKFRICLKVQDRADSQDVIKRPDAAELSTTGRFYLQVGYNELFETGQSAWSGAPYFPSDRIITKNDENVVVINNLGQQILSVSPTKTVGTLKQHGKQIDATVKYLNSLAESDGIHLCQMWKEPLPLSMEVSSITTQAGTLSDKVAAVCGLIDDPDNQDQYPLVVDISKGGNVLIYGISGSGRTTFLCTMIHQLITAYPPEALNLHLIDCGTGSLSAFREAPQVGHSLTVSDASDIENMFKSLKKEVARRKEHFAKVGGEFSAYYASGKRDIPCVVVVINNYAGFYEVYSEKEDDMASLSREGSKYGIYFVVAATAGGSVRNRVAQNFKQVYVLQMNDRIDYSAILGNTAGVYPVDNPGRGIFKVSQQAFEFQVAYVNDLNDYNRFAYYSDLSKKLLLKHGGKKPDGLRAKAYDVDFTSMQRYCVLSTTKKAIPVGINTETDEPLYLSFSSTSIVPVMSADTQHIGFMRQLLKMLVQANAKVVVFDVDNIFKLQVANQFEYVYEATALNKKLADTVNELVNRFKAKKKGEVHNEAEFSPLFIVINNFASVDSLLTDDIKQRLYDLLENGAGLGAMIILSGTPQSVSAFAANKWFRKRFSHSDGIWVGAGYSQQNIFTAARPYSQTDINADSCYTLDSGVIQTGRRLMDNADEYGRE
ncbi:MAG: type VII secretion protein EssC [Clostridia bacterium]|nr:type VII secretion protein EssC [Clostridia bacterium]